MKSIPKQPDWPPIPTESPITFILIGVTLTPSRFWVAVQGSTEKSEIFKFEGFGFGFGIP